MMACGNKGMLCNNSLMKLIGHQGVLNTTRKGRLRLRDISGITMDVVIGGFSAHLQPAFFMLEAFI